MGQFNGQGGDERSSGERQNRREGELRQTGYRVQARRRQRDEEVVASLEGRDGH